MKEKIERLKELVNTNLFQKISPMEWVDHYPIDEEKVIIWNSEIMEILESIDSKYAEQFYNVQKNVTIEHNLGDFAKSENLDKSKECLKQIIQKIEKGL